jgi:non-specific serine/threonine protein kinase
MTLAPGTRVASYRLERLLGRGGMSEVFLATDERLERVVALKVMSVDLAATAEARERFVLESRAAASLDHPHVVPVYDVGETDGRPFVAMQFVDGLDLDELVRRDGPLDAQVTLSLLRGVSAALDVAHGHGLVHRDVKPSNILVAELADGAHAYLCDFGLAKVLAASPGLTRAGDIVGTPDYMAPEAIEGLPVDGRGDVYSLACVLYACLTGRRPFERETEIATLWAHVSAAPPRLSDARPDLASLDAVVARGMSKDREARYATAGALIDAAAAELRSGAGSIHAQVGFRPGYASLPIEPEPLIGRESDLQALSALLDTHRLVTLVGPGGIGKTRLARELAKQRSTAPHGDAVWIGLESLPDASLLAAAIERELAAAVEPGATTEESNLLVVLDNFEQLLEAAPVVSAQLAAMPRLHVLVTSREPLHIAGEQVFDVRPLTGDDAESLFVARATSADSTFAPDENVASICARLDGLPLALELAAARVRLLGTGGLLERLDQRLPLLTGGRRDAPARQRTLEATIAWSYELLNDAEQTSLRRLAAFVGGWTIDAAQLAADVDVEMLASLLEKSVIRRVVDADEVRFTMLETIREFAAARLAEAQERVAVQARLAAYYLEFAERADAALERGDEPWLRRLRWDADNLQGALAWSRDSSDLTLHGRLVASLGRYWYELSAAVEGLHWTRPVLEERAKLEPALRIRILRNAERFMAQIDRVEEGLELAEERLALARAEGDDAQAALALNNLGIFAEITGDAEQARRRFQESAEIFRALGDHRLSAPLANLGRLQSAAGEYRAAHGYIEEALVQDRAAGDTLGATMTLINLAATCLLAGDVDEAFTHCEEAVAVSLELEAYGALMGALEGLAGALALSGGARHAAVIHGAVDAERRRRMVPIDRGEASLRELANRALEGALTPAELEAARAEGEGLELEEVARLYLRRSLRDTDTVAPDRF